MPSLDAIYLNHAGTSWPKPLPVQAAVEEAWNARPEHWPDRFVADYVAVASFYHTEEKSRLLLTPGCTSALSVAVADHPWTRGDRVVTSGMEHHALHRPLVKLADSGVDLVVLPRSMDSPIDCELLEKELRQGGVRLVAMAAASNVTGELFPVADVVRLSHEYGALVLIDAAQIAGWWDLDIPATGADLVAFAGHKGPQAPWGIGGLYVAPGVTMQTPAATCQLPSPGHAVACSPMPGYCDVGSVDRIALSGLAAGVCWLSEPAQQRRLPKAREQIRRLQETLLELSNVMILGSQVVEQRMPTVAFKPSHLPIAETAGRLLEEGLIVAGGLQCAPLAHETLGTAPDGVIRISVGPQTEDEEIDRGIEILTQVLS